MKVTKLLLIFTVALALGFFYGSGFHHNLTLSEVQENLEKIRGLNTRAPILVQTTFILTYVFLTSLSIPGAIVLTLLAGSIFGTVYGTALVSFASTAGATVAFMLSRTIFRSVLMMKYRQRLLYFDQRLRRDGNRYLLSLRLIPLSPFVVINAVLGLTGIRTWSFIWITFVGMLPGNLVYVYAGRKIAAITSPTEILTWPIILLLTVIGLVPFIANRILRRPRDTQVT